MPDRVKAITLDLDDTLWAVEPVIERAERLLHEWCTERAPKFASALPPAEFALYRRGLAKELPHLAHDFTALRLESLRRALSMHGEDHTLAEAAMEVFLEARNRIDLFPEVQESLERLSRRYKLAVISNGNADVHRIGIGDHFVAVVNARSAGCPKPDPRIFHAACDALGCSPHEVLHVGDDVELDVRGAVGAGSRAAWINRHGRAWVGGPCERVEFADLRALCEWLGA